MSHTELEEDQTQIGKPLDQGFNRPSFGPK